MLLALACRLMWADPLQRGACYDCAGPQVPICAGHPLWGCLWATSKLKTVEHHSKACWRVSLSLATPRDRKRIKVAVGFLSLVMPGCREHIKDNIVPRAVKWFTGEALAEETDEDEVRWWASHQH